MAALYRRSESIELLKQSLPELTDAAFDRMYRLAFIRAHAGLLGYESRREESWDEILDCLAAERERRYQKEPEISKERIERLRAAKRIPPTSQEDSDKFRKRFHEEESTTDRPET